MTERINLTIKDKVHQGPGQGQGLTSLLMPYENADFNPLKH